ncbi:MAG: ribulose-bisphosphate carboxylase large subunit, partial [Candidatus Micrarchaeota archaeon]
MAYGGYSDYLKLHWEPEPEKYLTATFTLRPAKNKSLRAAAEATAAESSIGTWTSLSTMEKRVLSHLQAKVFSINHKKKQIKIAYPVELFEPNNAAQLLSDIAGNIFGMKEIKSIRLEDFTAPTHYTNSFPGPAFGMFGIRQIIGTTKISRPHLGTIVKPKVGLSPKESAKVAYDAWSGGLDLVKDDENLTSHPFSNFESRISHMLDAKDKVESKCGKKKIYAPNITAPAHIMLKRAELVKEMGGKCIMIDILTAGFSSLQFIRSQNLNLFIHAHRAMHAAITRNKFHGISMLALAKLSRMCGCDQLHIGAVLGKMEGGKKEVLQIHNAINSKMGHLNSVFSVCSGGLSPLHIPELIQIFGRNIIIQAGGGVHGHPKGTRAG